MDQKPVIIGGEPPAPSPRYTKEYDPTVMAWVLFENSKVIGYVFNETIANAIISALDFRRRALSILPDLFVSSSSLTVN